MNNIVRSPDKACDIDGAILFFYKEWADSLSGPKQELTDRAVHNPGQGLNDSGSRQGLPALADIPKLTLNEEASVFTGMNVGRFRPPRPDGLDRS